MGMGQYLWRHQAELFTPLQGQRMPHLSTLDCARFFIGGGAQLRGTAEVRLEAPRTIQDFRALDECGLDNKCCSCWQM